MKTWELSCIHRETGREPVETVKANDERGAFALINDRGLMVGRVLHLESDPSPAPPPPIAHAAEPGPLPEQAYAGSMVVVNMLVFGVGLAGVKLAPHPTDVGAAARLLWHRAAVPGLLRPTLGTPRTPRPAVARPGTSWASGWASRTG